MAREIILALEIVAILIALGLILRYGNSSDVILQDIEGLSTGIISDLTLKGKAYAYYGPGKN